MADDQCSHNDIWNTDCGHTRHVNGRRWAQAMVALLLLGLGAPPIARAEPPAKETPFKSLFDGKTLGAWKKTQFGGEGDVEVKDGRLIINAGVPMSGVTFTGECPTMNYEISLEAMRVNGSDFFCALTFPVADSPCSFIVGGWGGGVVGLSSIDGNDASENETTKYEEFANNRWYAVRVCVRTGKIEAWIDKKQMVDLDTKDRGISIRGEVELSRPLGIATYNTTAALRDIKVRRLAVPPTK